MRVIAGSAGGLRLKTHSSRKVRPTADRVKEALFSMLESRVDLHGLRVLDLYAGSGALGIEALSRGAEAATFVERDRLVGKILLENVRRCGFGDRIRVVTRAVQAAVRHLGDAGAGFDLVLIDPPYADRVANRLLAEIDAAGIVESGGMVAVEHDCDEDVVGVGSLRLTQTRRYGNTSLSLLQSHPDETPPQ